MKDIGTYLRDTRKARGLTMLQVAESVGVSEATVSRWERGEIKNMRRDRIQALAKVLCIKPTIITGDIEPPVQEVLTEQEQQLLKSFRSLKPADRERAIQMIKILGGTQ